MQNKNKYTNRGPNRVRPFVAWAILLLAIFLMWRAGAWVFGKPSQGEPAAQTVEAKVAGVAENSFFTDASTYPVVVMIDNSPEARPYHAGLSEAVVVYETLAEGGSTRLEALFAGAPPAERVGPVRSARPYFVQIAAGWGAFYWHSGGSPEGLALIRELKAKNELTDFNEISGLGTVYLWRDKSLAAPHNLFTSGEKIKEAMAAFSLKTLPEGKLTWQWEKDANDKKSQNQAGRATGPASKISVIFSPGMVFNSSYVYDSSSELYQRSLANKPHKDYNTAKQLATANVIIQKVPAETALPSGYERVDFNITGEGDAWFFRDGRVFIGRWKKADQAAQTEWLLNDKPYILKRGQTWVEIVPGERTVTYE